MKVAHRILGLMALVLMMGCLAAAQQQQLSIGENTKLNAGGLFSFGYAGDYGDAISSDHGLTFGVDGKLSGSYYSPNFLSFSATPYYNQSRSDSSYQSLTGASGIDGTANFFTGSNFPGAVTYHYDHNSTGTFGLTGQPNFTTYGSGQGFGINWSALLPGLPTLSVGYSQGSGHSSLYGTDAETDSSTRLFNVHSNYQIEGFRLNAYFDHNTFDSKYPAFLAGAEAEQQDSTGHDLGFAAQHALPLHGSFSIGYNRSSATSDYLATEGPSVGSSNVTNYTTSTETANASFHPTQKLSFNVSENYAGNLNGYLVENLGNNGAPPPPGVDMGSGSHSYTLGGGVGYSFTDYLMGQAQATYYNQYYFGNNYTGEFLSGSVNCSRKLWNTFSFSGAVIDSSNGQGTNALGFLANLNAFHRFGGWQASGQFSYAQNVQTLLVTYTTSYYQYNANLHRRFSRGMQWTAAFNGSHSGLTNYQGTSSHSEGYSTSFGMPRFIVDAQYSQSSGVQLLGAGGIIQPGPAPGLTDFILFTGSAYGGGISVTPIKRMSISGTFSRAISNTLATIDSHNNTEIYNAQLQYHLRRISLQAGYTRFTQGISAIGAPVNNTSYFVGMTRWFDFF